MDADLHARKVAALPPKLFAEDAVASLGGEARLRPTVGAAAATTVMVGQPCMSPLLAYQSALCFDRPPIAAQIWAKLLTWPSQQKMAMPCSSRPTRSSQTQFPGGRTASGACSTGPRRPPVSFPFESRSLAMARVFAVHCIAKRSLTPCCAPRPVPCSVTSRRRSRSSSSSYPCARGN